MTKKLIGKGYSYLAIYRELDRRNIKPIGYKWHHRTIKNILIKAAKWQSLLRDYQHSIENN